MLMSGPLGPLTLTAQTPFAAFGRTGSADPLDPGTVPSAPIGLVAETALNVHSELTTDKGVLLTWDVPMDMTTLQGGIHVAITDYVIQVSVDGGAWTMLDDDVDTVTDWTHSDPLPAATEQRAYQVAAKNSGRNRPLVQHGALQHNVHDHAGPHAPAGRG